MSKLVQMKLGDSTILVEAADEDLRLVSTGNSVLTAADKAYAELVQNEIVENCRVLVGAFETLKDQPLAPSKANVEFGLQFTGEGNIYLVKVSAQASIKVTLEWQLSPLH